MDQMVLTVQQWLNTTYGSNSKFSNVFPNGVTADGFTGTQVEKALVTALQIEIGISAPDGIFGPATASAFTTMQVRTASNLNNPATNKEYILQGGFWCKGYNPGSFNGVFYTATQQAVQQFQSDAGLTNQNGVVTAMIMKALLNTDPFSLATSGDVQIRMIQQYLNNKYNAYTGLLPTNGVYSAQTSKALIYALQAEEGLGTSVANGNFGSTTKRCCPNIPYDNVAKNYSSQTYTTTTITNMTKLIQYLLYCNGWQGGSGSKYDPGSFAGTLTTDTVSALKAFQGFAGLSQTGNVTINEWMALMVSTGNPDRTGRAIDCATRLTPEKASALYLAGYTTVGRYLTGDIVVNSTRVAKNLLRPEMENIFDARLNLFVIFQDSRQYYHENPNEKSIVNYFSESRGHDDAEKAFSAAKSLGVPRGENIYFAVDYDFMESQVNSMITPYFRGINAYADSVSNLFKIGIYGARNTCTLVKAAGYSQSSFVSDMSTGYSGNLGFALPEDWAFDQIQTLTQTSTDGSFGIDKDVISGRYSGFNDFEATYDDEWDLISKNGRAEIFTVAPDSNSQIPIYWSKVKDANGNYVVKYPMYDYINFEAFFSVRETNPNRDDNDNDHINYVYFRDVGGNLNAGYIDYSIFGIGMDPYQLSSYQDCEVSRGETLSNLYVLPSPPVYCEIEFLVTQPLNVVTPDGYACGIVIPDTKITIPSTAITGKTFPNMIQATQKMVPGSDVWQQIVGGYNYGFIDLGFEYGVSPSDRAIITNYMD